MCICTYTHIYTHMQFHLLQITCRQTHEQLGCVRIQLKEHESILDCKTEQISRFRKLYKVLHFYKKFTVILT